MALKSDGPRKIQAIFADHGIPLASQEARFLDILLGRERLVLHRELIERLWPRADGGPLSANDMVRLYHYRCAKKLLLARIPWCLEVEKGRGYRLRYKR